MVRDHRNMPLLLVMLTEPCTAANQPRYPATGSTPVSSAAPALRQPTRRSSRNSGMSSTSGKVVGRTVTEAPVIRPAVTTCHIDGGRRGSTAAPSAHAKIQCRRIRLASQGQAARQRRQTGGAPGLVAAWPAPVPSAPAPASLTVVTDLLERVRSCRACEGNAGPLRRV